MTESLAEMGERKTAEHTAKAEEYLEAMDDAAKAGDLYTASFYADLAEAHMHRIDHFMTVANNKMLFG